MQIGDKMEVFDAIKTRRSVRKYLDKKIDESDMLKLLEAARLSPSARNIQNRRFVIIENIDGDIVKACNDQEWISTCPMLIAGVIDPGVNKWAETDMAIAFEHIVLEAVELGLGTCWIGAFDGDKVRSILGVPSDLQVYALLSIGYPASNPSQMISKKPLEEIWSREKYDF